MIRFEKLTIKAQEAMQSAQELAQRYWQALALGGSRPLPDLFAAAGAKFRFDADTLRPLVEAVAEELDSLN